MTELIDRISAALVGLKMPRSLEALGPTLRRLEQGEITAVEAIDALLSEDCALRETRRIDIALRTAKLLPVKTVESFDFAFQPSLDRERIAALAQFDFIRRRETVHFLGPPGTGESHLATALGVAAVKAGKSVYKTTLAEPAESLAKAEQQGRLAEKIRFFARAAILVVDEIGCLPISRGGASLFFRIVNASCEKGAMILTSNRSFAEWGDIFGDPVVATALLDRLHHHAAVVRIEGASYRPGKHADLIPEHVRTNTLITPPPPPKKRGRPKKETRTDDRAGSSPKNRKLGNFTLALLGNFALALTDDARGQAERNHDAVRRAEHSGRDGHRQPLRTPPASGVHRVLGRIEKEAPAGRDIHAFLDNYSAHKHSAVADWLADRRRWTLHFTPTSCSWMNAVEGFFGKLARRHLRRGVYDSLEDLEAAIKEFIALHNEKEAKPFK